MAYRYIEVFVRRQECTSENGLPKVWTNTVLYVLLPTFYCAHAHFVEGS
jgi:hypothetical protein